MDLQPYDLLFYKGKGVISKIIKRETKSEYSHVALVLDDKHLIEIDWKYNLAIRHIKYKNIECDIYRLKSPLTREQKRLLNKYIYSTLSSKYDFMEILKIFFRLIFKINIKSQDVKNKYICSTWVNECFQYCGIILNDSDVVSPQELIGETIFKVEQIDN